MNILFKTVTGSRLYGLHNKDSDYDYFVVVSKFKTNKARYSTHKIKGELDTVTVDHGAFTEGLRKGVPQYLEAVFFPHPEGDLIGPWRRSYRFTTQAWDTYLRTIKSSAMQDTMKARRHALRLAYNMADLRRYGRFNPHLTPEQVYTCTVLAELNDADVVYDYALSIAWS